MTFIALVDLVRCFLSTYSGSDLSESWLEARLFFRDAISLRFSATSGASSLSILFLLSCLNTWADKSELSISTAQSLQQKSDPKKMFREVQELVASLLGAILFVATDQLIQVLFFFSR